MSDRTDEPRRKLTRRAWLGTVAAGGAALAGCSGGATPPRGDKAEYGYEIVASYPHDPAAFTQGLVIDGGELFEGTGLRGESTLRRVELETGKVLQNVDLHPDYFGEGIAVVGDEIYQITYEEESALVWDRKTFVKKRDHRYQGEGWGLTFDGRWLIMSDGTDVLRFRDPRTFNPVAEKRVRYEGKPVGHLNELEYIDGQVYANVWGSDRVALIDPRSGRVTAWIDLTGLLRGAARTGAEDVLNGIAWDAARGRLFVTGKLWPRLFEIRVRRGGR